MNRLTPVFLVLLRLAIGWHIFFEGLEKVQDPSWTSAGYLRESAGPFAGHFQELGGDPVLDRMTPLDASAGGPKDRFPPALAREWSAYFEQFADYYELDEPERQAARGKLEQRQEQTALWLIQGKELVAKPTQFGTVPPHEKTTPQRLDEYRQALETYRQKKDEAGRFGEGAAAELTQARGELNRQRSALLADLGRQAAEMKAALYSIVEEKNKQAAQADPDFKPKDPLVEQPPSRWRSLISFDWLRWSRLEWSDFIVRWGLPLVGVCLLFGFFTRTACIAGAVFLVLFYIPMPPWPGLPGNPRAEGHYLFINKNVIEMLALLALATTRSGQWVGLDALWAWCCPGKKAKVEEEARTEPPAPPVKEEPRTEPEPALPAEPAAEDAGTFTPRPDLETPSAEDKPDRPDPSTIIYSPKDE